MHFLETKIPGAYLIELEPKHDDRGFFARIFCTREFQAKGLDHSFVQANSSFSKKKGTLRGMHFQLAPMQEAKLVKCVLGSLFDVVLDLRSESPTFGKWYGAELSARNGRMMYVPKGCAHGFLTLEDATEAFYFVSEFYSADLERGLRWNDPTFAIQWPFEPLIVSQRDQNHQDYGQITETIHSRDSAKLGINCL